MRKALVLGALLLITCLPALAASPHYSYAEGGWLNVNPSGGSSEDGWFLGGSFGTPRFQFFADYSDVGPLDFWRIGGGWHGLLGVKADLVAEAAYLDAGSDNGIMITAGVRWMVLKRLELNGFVNYTDIGSENDTSFELNGIFNFTKRIGVGAGYVAGDEVDTTRVFVRFNFGKMQSGSSGP